MNKFEARPYLLKGKIQNYAWGTKNENAFIPQFLNIPAEKDVPYAELWMGAHPKAPSEIVINGSYLPLDKLIKEFPGEILGMEIYNRFRELPFLFKILSAGEALSIQAHPNKQQAEILHSKDPQHYPDDNHKPEIAIALSGLTALVGFKSFNELIKTLQDQPEISEFIGTDISTEMKQAAHLSEIQQKPLVKKMYQALMIKSLSKKDDLYQAIKNMDERLKQKSALTKAEKKFFELRAIYPGPDSGLFSLFLLNMVQINPGEAIFLKAGLPHAYLEGTIVECMANSDNVVRAGLTAKFQDVGTLVDILTYETTPVDIQKGSLKDNTLIYSAPVPEFQVSRLNLNGKPVEQNTNRVQILLLSRGQISISWDKNKKDFMKGQSILIPACLTSYRIESQGSASIFKVTVP